MFPFNGTPMVIRTARPIGNGPLPGLGLTEEQYQRVRNEGREIPRERTPEPVSVEELRRTPSPFLKKEPEDRRKYSAHYIEDDEVGTATTTLSSSSLSTVAFFKRETVAGAASDTITIDDDEYDPTQYDPNTPIGTIESSNPTTLNLANSAQPALRRSKRIDGSERILSTVNGEVVEAKTECFSAQYRYQPFLHVLKCHGVVETEEPVACGANCQPLHGCNPTIGRLVQCTHARCAAKRASQKSSIFMPAHRKGRSVTPAMLNAGGKKATPGVMSGRINKSYATRSSLAVSRPKTYDEEIAERNAEMAANPALAELVHKLPEAGFVKSKRHAGYAYQKEVHEEEASRRLLTNLNGLPLNLTNEPAVKRELRGLKIQGTDKLSYGVDGAFGYQHDQAKEDAMFAQGDRPFGHENDKGRRGPPVAFADTQGAAPRRSGLRCQMSSGFFSMPETAYNSMALEQGNNEEDEDAASMQLLAYDQEAADQEADIEADQSASPPLGAVEVCRVCEEVGEEQLHACKTCHHHFHFACAGVTDAYQRESYQICSGEGCVNRIGAIRYKCYHAACQGNEFCSECFYKLALTHGSGVPGEHRLWAVAADFSGSLKAEGEAAENGFECRGCKDRRPSQFAASKSLSRKKLNTMAQIRREAKAKQKASGVSAGRLRVARKHGRIAKTVTPSKRYSGRLRTRASTPLTPLPIVAEADEDVKMGENDEHKFLEEVYGAQR